MVTYLECARCGTRHDAGRLQGRCTSCGGTLLARYDGVAAPSGPPGMWRYAGLLPLTKPPVSLGETETPLHRLGDGLYVKDDGPLPGGTFKARGAAVGVSRAVELGATSFVLPSAGNAGGAWARYAAAAGVPITVTMARTAPEPNQQEVRDAGGRLELVDGTLADAGRRAAEIAAATGAFLASTFGEPYRLEGKKTAWFELFEQLGGLPGTIVFPVGGGVGLVAAAKAVAEARAAGWCGLAPARCHWGADMGSAKPVPTAGRLPNHAPKWVALWMPTCGTGTRAGNMPSRVPATCEVNHSARRLPGTWARAGQPSRRRRVPAACAAHRDAAG